MILKIILSIIAFIIIGLLFIFLDLPTSIALFVLIILITFLYFFLNHKLKRVHISKNEHENLTQENTLQKKVDQPNADNTIKTQKKYPAKQCQMSEFQEDFSKQNFEFAQKKRSKNKISLPKIEPPKKRLQEIDDILEHEDETIVSISQHAKKKQTTSSNVLTNVTKGIQSKVYSKNKNIKPIEKKENNEGKEGNESEEEQIDQIINNKNSNAIDQLFADLDKTYIEGSHQEDFNFDDISPNNLLKSEIFKESENDQVEKIIKDIETEIDNKNFIDALKLIEEQLSKMEMNKDNDVYDELLYMKATIFYQVKKLKDAKKNYENYFNHIAKKHHPQYEERLNTVTQQFYKDQHIEIALVFLLALLDFYRNNKNYESMNHTYYQITAIYNELNNQNKLITTFQNHLAIKKELKDYEGQLKILDSLGKIYFDNGDTAGSNRCYEQSILIKKEMLESSQ